MVADDNAGRGGKAELKETWSIGVLHVQWDADYPACVCYNDGDDDLGRVDWCVCVRVGA